ncbi:MAG: cysteine hydrolase family protein [Parvibaculales bacterium]
MASYIDEFTRPIDLCPQSTALIVVDMQYASGSRTHGLGKMLGDQGRLDSAQYRFDRIENLVIPNNQKLLACFREVKAKVIYLTVGSVMSDYSDAPAHMRRFYEATNNHEGTKEHEIVAELTPQADEPVFNKVTMGGFASTGLGSYLTTHDIESVVVTGVSTNNCVGMTGMEAADRGFGVVLASDASGTCSDAMQSAFEGTFERLWGRVAQTQSIIEEMKS